MNNYCSKLNKDVLMLSTQSFERYQPKFKHVDKLDAKRLPNSIKTTRSNAFPNTQVSDYSLSTINSFPQLHSVFL